MKAPTNDKDKQQLADYNNLLQETQHEVLCKDTNSENQLNTYFVQDKLRKGNNLLWMMHATEGKERVTLGFAVASTRFAKVNDYFLHVFHLEVICGEGFGKDMFLKALNYAMDKTVTVNDITVHHYAYFELEALNQTLDAKYVGWVNERISVGKRRGSNNLTAPEFVAGLADKTKVEYTGGLWPRHLNLEQARMYLNTNLK
jgi:hypothetical protein